MGNVTALDLARVRREIRRHVEMGGRIVHPSDEALAAAGIEQVDVIRMLLRCPVVELDPDRQLCVMQGPVDDVDRELLVWVEWCRYCEGKYRHIGELDVMVIWK